MQKKKNTFIIEFIIILKKGDSLKIGQFPIC